MSDGGGWRNPPAAVRVALVGGVYAALGVLGGMYVALFSRGRVDPDAASVVGAVAFALFGAWFEGRE